MASGVHAVGLRAQRRFREESLCEGWSVELCVGPKQPQDLRTAQKKHCLWHHQPDEAATSAGIPLMAKLWKHVAKISAVRFWS